MSLVEKPTVGHSTSFYDDGEVARLLAVAVIKLAKVRRGLAKSNFV